MSRIVERAAFGAVAGFCATMVMTAAMRALHHQLASQERYPLPPREITETTLGRGQYSGLSTVLAHFGYGAAAGALFGTLPRQGTGLIFGPLVWFASYLGWVPGMRILVPATYHPPARNVLMLGVHLVWGACLAAGSRELEKAAHSCFGAGELKDRQNATKGTKHDSR